MQLPGVDIPGAAVLYLYGSSLKCGRYARPIAEMIGGKSAKIDRITADKNGGPLPDIEREREAAQDPQHIQ